MKPIIKNLKVILFFSLITGIWVPPVHAEGEAQATEVAVAAPIERSDRLTLELQAVSIFDVFKILSKKSGLNIVAGKNVQGQVSIFLQDVPIREALMTILQSQGLAGVEEDGIIKVMTEDEFLKKFGRPYGDTRVTKYFHLNHASADALASKLLDSKTAYGKIVTEPRTNTLIVTELPNVLDEMEKTIQESDQPQQTEVFRLDYTKAEELEPKLKSFMEGTSGKMEVDSRSNRIIVFDIPSRIDRIRDIVKAFDVKARQVLIDAKIIEVQLTDANRKGINWREIISKAGQFDAVSIVAPLTVSPPTGVSSLSTLTLGSSQNDLQVILDLLERVGKTNLLSSPRLTVMNNEEASLAVATREPFVSQTVVQTNNSTNTADNVQFVDVGVTLKVQPRISHDRYVEMKIKPEVSSSTRSLELEGVSQGSNTAFTRTVIPVVTTQGLETTVLIQSGHTLVIGGLIQDHQSKQSSRVPVLGNLPLVGRAFQSNSDDFTKTELVVFLTPQIMDPSENTKEDRRFLTPQGNMKPFDTVGDYPLPVQDGLLGAKKGPYWKKQRRGIKPK
jgi:general secretion pathway protein D